MQAHAFATSTRKIEREDEQKNNAELSERMGK